MVLYDYSLQEVPYVDIVDDGTILYRLEGVWNKKIEAYVTRPYYAIEYIDGDKFARYVDKIMCVGDMPIDIRRSYKCKGGRIVTKMAVWILDKRFKELLQLL